MVLSNEFNLPSDDNNNIATTVLICNEITVYLFL